MFVPSHVSLPSMRPSPQTGRVHWRISTVQVFGSHRNVPPV
jgi:hypothetical protein